jgi:UDP-3-O-[3-hydroxymyristoyl] glucosamine N-acyltransferase
MAGVIDDMIHAGEIVVEDGALILANAVIAAAVFRQATRIGREARIGNCAFVSHNVQIGSRTYVGHGCVVNGNVRVGEEVWIGPGATVTNNISIGDHAHIALGSVVIRSVAARERVAGNFAVARRPGLQQATAVQQEI